MPNVNANAPHFVGEGDQMMHVIPGGYGLGSYEYDEDDDDMPESERPHDYNPSCECWACYEEGVMQRFRASHAPGAA